MHRVPTAHSPPCCRCQLATRSTVSEVGLQELHGHSHILLKLGWEENQPSPKNHCDLVFLNSQTFHAHVILKTSLCHAPVGK